MPCGVLQFDAEAVGHHPLPRAPASDPGPGPQHDPGEVGPHDVIGLIVSGCEPPGARVPLQEREGGDGLEDRAPDRVVIHGAGHGRHQDFARTRHRRGHLRQMKRLGGVPVCHPNSVEHVLLILEQHRCPVEFRHRQRLYVFGTSFRRFNGFHERAVHVLPLQKYREDMANGIHRLLWNAQYLKAIVPHSNRPLLLQGGFFVTLQDVAHVHPGRRDPLRIPSRRRRPRDRFR